MVSAPSKIFRCGRFSLPLDFPLVMGVVNITPDSFSDGGKFLERDQAIAHARRLAAEGADIIDIGGESTRPGAAPVSEEEELQRVIPVLEEISDLCVSVDTRRPAVMRAALAAGASMINDVQALQAPGAIDAVGESNCAVCLMHMKGEPATMQREPHYDDVVREVRQFLRQRLQACQAAGIGEDRLVADPGFGFGKTFLTSGAGGGGGATGIKVTGCMSSVGLRFRAVFICSGKIIGSSSKNPITAI